MEKILRPPFTKFTDLMPIYQQLKLLLSFYILQPMKFEVHGKQYYIVNKVEKGAAGKNFTNLHWKR